MKTCTKCGDVKPVEMFSPRKNTCKSCRAEYMRRYTAENRETVYARNRQWFEENKVQVLAQAKRYRAENGDAIRARRKDRYAQNREETLKKNQEWYTKNIDRMRERDRNRWHLHKIATAASRQAWVEANRENLRETKRRDYVENCEVRREQMKAYHKANPHVFAAHNAKRRAAELQRTPQWLSQDHLDQIKEVYARREAVTKATGVLHHVDHIVPLQGKNVSGLHVPWNLQVIPAAENIGKRNRYEGLDAWEMKHV